MYKTVNARFWRISESNLKSHLQNIVNERITVKNIKYHYDLGINFYEKWLDKTMTYSSALFDNKNTNLSDAQFNKYRKVAETLSLDSNS